MMELLLPNAPSVTQGFVLMAVIRANTSEISDLMRGEDRMGADASVPDSYRLPVRASEVAKCLRLPHETARRNLTALVESGHCIQVPQGGFIVPGAALVRANILTAFAPNFQNLRRMLATLGETGVLARWDTEP